jgi:hypothetical protein
MTQSIPKSKPKDKARGFTAFDQERINKAVAKRLRRALAKQALMAALEEAK